MSPPFAFPPNTATRPPKPEAAIVASVDPFCRASSGSLSEDAFQLPDLAFADAIAGVHHAFPILVASPSVVRAFTDPSRTADQTRLLWVAHSEKELADLYFEQPLEDGFDHPADSVVERLLVEHDQDAAQWLSRQILRSNVAWRGSLLRSVARAREALTLPWGFDLAAAALADQDVEVRDAAVRALEAWGGPQAAAILRTHRDPVAWLDAFAHKVASDNA